MLGLIVRATSTSAVRVLYNVNFKVQSEPAGFA